MAYPTSTEIKAFLYAAGLTDDAITPTGELADAYVNYTDLTAALVVDWERDIHRKFLAATLTREYDAPANRQSRLWTGDLISVSAITFASQTIASTDYLLGPTNAADLGLPFQYVEFFRRWQQPVTWGNRRQLVVVGSYGYTATVPENVKRALLAKAVADLFPLASSSATGGGAIQQREGDLEEQYGLAPGENLEKRFRLVYDRAVAQYRCMTSGIGGGW